MTDMKPIRNVAPLRNVSALTALIERVEAREAGLPGLATFHGYSGYGKTTAAVYAANRFDAIIVQAKSVWSPTYFCQSILSEMGLESERGLSRMVDQIARELTFSGRPLLIDDVQLLAGIRLLHVIRDIYESSETTIILIGEETMPAKIGRLENLAGRILEWVPAQPACIDDVGYLAQIYVPGIDIATELQEKLLVASVHSVRRVCTNLSLIRQVALGRGLKSVGLAEWKSSGRAFALTSAPSSRRDLQ